MIFDKETRKHWPKTKTDYKVGDRVKIIDLCDETSDQKYLGRIGTITSVQTGEGGVGESPDDPFFIIRVPGLALYSAWSEELRPAEPGEVSASLPADSDPTALSFDAKAALIGVFKKG